MFGQSFKLFRIFGFSVGIDLSWFFIAILVTWSLAGLFSQAYPEISTAAAWWMGVVGALGLFASIVVHELAHSLVARQYGVEMRGITLFIFGGVAEMNEEPPSPLAEFMIAVIGPITSVAIGGLSYVMLLLARAEAWPTPAQGIFAYLAWINVVLAAFNLLPAFPLDGGRIARSILWGFRGSLKWATRIMSRVGAAFGILFMIYGGLRFLMFDFIGGMWILLVGMFLYHAARQSYQQLLVRRILQGEPIARFVQPDVKTVPADASVRELVEDYIYRYHHKMFPVVEEGRLVGCVTTRDVSQIPREQWDHSTIRQVAAQCSPLNTIRPEADAFEALERMNQNGVSRLMVTDDGHLQGMISLKDIMRLIALKLELEEGQPAPAAEDI